MRGVRARPPVSSFSSTLELVKTTVCIFTGRLCSNAMELVELDPLAPVTEVQGVGLRVPTVYDTNSAFFSVISAKGGESLDNAPNIYFVSRVAVWRISRSLLMMSCLVMGHGERRRRS
ncbi:uncharacterized protein [Triticum aestivum]|uniref:uncharacterized protein isoform X2 n=1 Tax=Triticum aestivum TaxID=4565 RepID=UPI001D02D5C0|nr:uncharacterized protein LOC123069463 isoform X2 [Triticum aestivum]